MGSKHAPGQRVTTRDFSNRAMWHDLNLVALRLGIWLSPVLLILYLIVYSMTGEPAYLVQGAAAVVILMVSVWRKRSGADAAPVLYLGIAAMLVGGAMSPSMTRGAMWGAVAVIAVVGALLLPRLALQRLLVFTGLGLVAQLAWPTREEITPSDLLINLGVTTTAALLGVLAVLRTKRALEESDRLRLEIFRRVPVGLFRTSPDGMVIDANPALYTMLGREPGSLHGKCLGDLHADPEEWDRFLEGLDDHAPQRFAHRMLTASGGVIWVRGFVQAVSAPDGTARYLEGSVEDVTQRREMEERSRINAERYRAVFDLAPVAIWEEDFSAVGEALSLLRSSGITDLRAYLAARPDETRRLAALIRFVAVNPAGVSLISAASPEEALALVVPRNPTPTVLDSLVDQLVAVWEDRQHLAVEVQGLTLDGDPLDLALSWAAARRDDGSLDLEHVVVVIADVSAIRAAEKQLAAIIDSKDELVASVSHELRTPITTILGMAFELRDHSSEFTPEEVHQFIAYIADQSRELSNIVDDLLVAARSDDTLSVHPEVVDLRDEVARMLAINPAGPQPSVEIPGRVLAWADPLRLRQIVRNLLTNARRYGGPRVQIEAGRGPHGIFLRVRDNGAGIPVPDREKVFEPYTRAGGDSAMPGSIGLGLPVSRRLARLMGGELSYRFDEGSVFELTLPDPARRAVA